MIAKRVIFIGRVQGVGFRYTVKDLARGFDVSGRVRNLPDGSVELQVAGDPAEVGGLIHEILTESQLASGIRSHSIEAIPVPDDCTGFRIER